MSSPVFIGDGGLAICVLPGKSDVDGEAIVDYHVHHEERIIGCLSRRDEAGSAGPATSCRVIMG